MDYLKKIVSHRASISLIIVLIIGYFMPNIFERYNIKQEQVTITNEQRNYNFYKDINNDNYSECFQFHHDEIGNKERFDLLGYSGGFLSVLNLSDFLLPRSIINFSDYNHNHIPEINFITYTNDSIFLNVYEYFFNDTVTDKNESNFQKRFITTGKFYNETLDLIADSIKYADLNGDGNDEALINIEAGFTLQPRRIYAIDLKNNLSYDMPKEGSMIVNFIPYDINKDKKTEIVLSTYSPNNIYSKEEIEKLKFATDSESVSLYNYYKKYIFDYNDNNPWLFTLNNKLNFLFKPIGFEEGYAYLDAYPFIVNDSVYIIARYESISDTIIQPYLMLFNSKGEKIKERMLLKKHAKQSYRFFNYTNNFHDVRLIDENDILYKISPNLELYSPIKLFKGFNPNLFKAIDLDNDNSPEFIFTSNNQEQLLISQKDFSHPVIINVPNDRNGIRALSLVKRGPDKLPLLAIQYNKVLYLFSYSKNPLYFLKYLIYLTIFTIIYLFILFIQKTNAQKLEKENKQLELEVKKRTNEITIKNIKLNEFVKIVSNKNHEINIQNQTLNEFQQKITNSIKYAKYIQSSVLPKIETLNELFSDTFLIYLPLDIISGDFYWWKKIDNYLFVSISDCTGHGVPGAFMSLLGLTFMEEAIENNIYTTSNILNFVRKKIIHTLKQSNKADEPYDGMDSAIIKINLTTNEITFSGAHNPLYIVSENNIFENNPELINNERVRSENINNVNFIEIKGDRMPLAIYKKMQDFKEYNFKLSKGDIFYMFTDGYYDQFGGKDGKKIKIGQIKELLTKNYSKDLNEQKQIISDYLSNWKNNNNIAHNQVDDITILGIKI